MKNYEYVVLKITYDDGWIDQVGIRVPKPSHRISVVSVMRIGEMIKVRLRNECGMNLRNVTVSLKYAGVLIGIPYRITIPLIMANSEVEVKFKVESDLNTLTVSIEYPDGFAEEETVTIILYKEYSVEIRCLFPEKNVDLGLKADYPLWLVNRGRAGVYKLAVYGLPSSMTYRFIKDGLEVGAIYLSEGEQTLVTLEIDVPILPVNFTVGRTISFNVSVLTEENIEAGSVMLKLTPVLTRGLQAYSKAWLGKKLSMYQRIHYPGIPYSTGLISKGSSVAAIFELLKGEYAFILYGPYVGTHCDLNLYILDLNGQRLATSANRPGEPELAFLKVNNKKDILVIIANEEATSAEAGEGIILVIKTIKPPNETDLVIKGPLYQAALLVQIPSPTGGTLTIKLQGSKGHIVVYRFTTNRERMEYDPFLPKGDKTVIFKNSTSIDYWVSRGEDYILLLIMTKSEAHIRVECNLTQKLKVTTGTYERDVAVAIAIIVTGLMALILSRGEVLIRP